MTDIEKLHWLRQLISKSETETVMDELLKSDWAVVPAVRKFQARWGLITKHEQEGTAGWEAVLKEKNAINAGLLNLMDDVERNLNASGKTKQDEGTDTIEKQLAQVQSELLSGNASEEMGLEVTPYRKAVEWLAMHKEGLSINAAAKAVGLDNPIHYDFFRQELERILSLVKGCLVVADRDMLDGLVYARPYTADEYRTALEHIRSKIATKLQDKGFKELDDILVGMKADMA